MPVIKGKFMPKIHTPFIIKIPKPKHLQQQQKPQGVTRERVAAP